VNAFKVGDYVIAPNSYYKFCSVFKIVAIWNNSDITLRRVIYTDGIEDLERCDITVKPKHNIKLVPYTEEAKILYGNS